VEVSPSLLDDPRAEHLSAAARRLLRRPRPRFRGLLHRWATFASIPLGVAAAFLADGVRGTVAMIIFAVGATLMLGVSAIVHLRDWPIERVELLIRLDHSAIFVMFATSATPIALMALTDRRVTIVLSFAFVGTLGGVIAEFLPFHPPRGLVNAIYITFGLSFLAFIPWMLDGLSLAQFAMLMIGGGFYAVGSIIVGAQWPDPWTNTFGYHEIWHVFVVIGAGFHYWLALDLVTL
jgi:hemolysin III